MPSFRQAAFLEEAIGSVLDQDYPHRELIVMDGGSDDGSVAVIERHQARLAYWTSAPDGGQSDALDQGFRRAPHLTSLDVAEVLQVARVR
ncbi:MAG TPA: glycosyltransferase, partial [Polyangiaceae bacterium]|nr:glycosyltransferase [Polyangiaceae bacterium]